MNTLICRAALFLALAVIASAQPVVAQDRLDPRRIAVIPEDLPPGFAFIEEQIRLEMLEGGQGVQLQTGMKREPVEQYVAQGPIFVGQMIVRVDPPAEPATFLAAIRDRMIQGDGMSPLPDHPNDGGTATLGKREDGIDLVAVAFIKNEFVIFTVISGIEGVVSPRIALDVAGISSAKYDAARR
jgi:hypothetical protein